jgi:hypothetical protein
MKTLLTLLAAGLVAGAAACAVFHGWTMAGHGNALRHSGPEELAWLRSEFGLGDEEFARITQLHLEYLPFCEALCARLEDLYSRLRPLVAASDEITPEIEMLLGEAAELRRECQITMLRHFYKVSQVMPEPQGKRYLARMRDLTLTAGTFDHGPTGH